MQEALDRVAKGRTVITIAHRLSTVQSAAQVAVIQGGGIAESGSHEELLQKGKTLQAGTLISMSTKSCMPMAALVTLFLFGVRERERDSGASKSP